MTTTKESTTHAAVGKKWAAILSSVGIVLTAVVPPAVSMLRSGSTNIIGNSVAIGGNVTQNTTNIITNAWIDGAKIILGIDTDKLRPDLDENSQLVETKPVLPKYEDKYLQAIGMISSLGNGGRNTIIPVRLENKTKSDLLIGHDFEVVTAVTDTGETNSNTGGCNLNGVRSFALAGLQKPYDPLIFTSVAPGASMTLKVSCSINLADPAKVMRLNVNIPLIRLDGESVRRFTLNIDGIPTSR